MLDKILAKLKEVSTWRGLIALVALAGVKLSPEFTEAIIQGAVALMAAIEVFRKEKAKPTVIVPTTADAAQAAVAEAVK